jgi:lipopolysaccharide assembly outer membrane protein LptD (OstA)
VEIKAQRGEALLQEERIMLTGQVAASIQSTQGLVRADMVEWAIPDKTITASGNINYQQPERNFRVQGDRAVANLEQQTVTVSGSDVISTLTAN